MLWISPERKRSVRRPSPWPLPWAAQGGQRLFLGGIDVYFSNFLSVKHRTDLEVINSELMRLQVDAPQKCFSLVFTYRAPNIPIAYWTVLELMTEAALVSRDIVPVGDLNEEPFSPNIHYVRYVITRKNLRRTEAARNTWHPDTLIDPIAVSDDYYCTVRYTRCTGFYFRCIKPSWSFCFCSVCFNIMESALQTGWLR